MSGCLSLINESIIFLPLLTPCHIIVIAKKTEINCARFSLKSSIVKAILDHLGAERENACWALKYFSSGSHEGH